MLFYPPFPLHYLEFQFCKGYFIGELNQITVTDASTATDCKDHKTKRLLRNSTSSVIHKTKNSKEEGRMGNNIQRYQNTNLPYDLKTLMKLKLRIEFRGNVFSDRGG